MRSAKNLSKTSTSFSTSDIREKKSPVKPKVANKDSERLSVKHDNASKVVNPNKWRPQQDIFDEKLAKKNKNKKKSKYL
jgi:hypothetical protein